MNKPKSNPGDHEDIDETAMYHESCQLGAAIAGELKRILYSEKDGLRLYMQLHMEIFHPPGVPDEVLMTCLVYHGLTLSSPSLEIITQIDLPGDQSLLVHARKKLAELQQVRVETTTD